MVLTIIMIISAGLATLTCLTLAIIEIVRGYPIGTILLQLVFALVNVFIIFIGVRIYCVKRDAEITKEEPTLSDVPDRAHIDTIMTVMNSADTTYEYRLDWNDDSKEPPTKVK